MLVTNISPARLEVTQARIDRMEADAYADRVLGELVDVAVRGARDLRPEIGVDHSSSADINEALRSAASILKRLGSVGITQFHQRLIDQKDVEIKRLAQVIRELEDL